MHMPKLPHCAACLLLGLLLAACVGIRYTDQPAVALDLSQVGAPPEAGVRVLAKAEEWRNSGVLLKRGQAYSVAASGRWRVWGGCRFTDADGIGLYGALCVDWGNANVKGWSHSTLIAKIGEQGVPFAVGKSYRFTAPVDGILYFHINDTPGHYWDNEGYADVTVRTLGPGSPQPQFPPAQPAAPSAAGPLARKKASAQAFAAPAPAPVAALPAPPVEEPPAAPSGAPAAAAEALPAVPPAQAQAPAAAARPAAPPPGRRVALIIGNGAYPNAPLKNPVNDARDMASALRSLGFEVILHENASLRQMEEGVDELWKRLRAGGAGLFFFAGHGLQVAGRNYLVPVDARLTVEQDVKYRCMDAGLVLGRMENAGNGLNIVILDACRNNPYARSWRSADQGLAKMDAPKGSLVAYATAPDSVAADGLGRNGIYTGQLLKHLRTPGLGIEELFKRVRIGVLGETGDKQVPWESSSLTGHFTFSTDGR